MAFVINGLWAAWFVYWHLAAFGTKPAAGANPWPRACPTSCRWPWPWRC